MHMFQDRHKEKWNNEMGIELETSKRHVNQLWSLSEPEQQTLAVDQLVWLYDLTFTSKSVKRKPCVCICVSGVGEINDLVFSGLLKGISIRQMEKWAVGILGIHIYIVLYSSVIIQINCLGQMVGLSSHAVCLFVCKWNVYMSRELWEESKRKQPIQPKRW